MRLRALEDKIQQIVALRNRVDHLEQQIELLRYEFTPATFSNLRYLNLDEIEDSFRVLLELVTKADQHQARIWERLIWKFIKNNRFNQVKDSFAEKKDLIKKIELDVSFETKALDEEILKDYKTFMDIFARRLDGVRAIKEYYDSLSKLSASVSLEKLEWDLVKTQEEVQKISENLWHSWLDLLPRLSSLPADQEALNQFNSY